MSKTTTAKKAPTAVISEEVEDTYPLGLNGPTEKQIDAWKEEHGKVFVANYYGDDVYVFRGITRSEYSALLNEMRADPRAGDEMWFESFFVSRILLWPEEITADQLNEEKEAGLASSLYNQVAIVCKFNTIGEPIEL